MCDVCIVYRLPLKKRVISYLHKMVNEILEEEVIDEEREWPFEEFLE